MAKKKEEVAEDIVMSSKDRMQKFRDILNKKAGYKVSYNLEEENPSEVKKWISTGSYLIDRIVAKGIVGGIPLGKIVEIAGQEAAGKSYIAFQIAANALKEGCDVVYFDSESAVDPSFCRKILAKNGFTIEDILYVQAISLEFVLETIEDMLSQTEKPIIFILDSVANVATESSIRNSFDPLQSMAEVARILSLSFRKLTIPLANHNSTWLLINQLKTNITNNMAEKLTDPLITPGGKAPQYLASLRLWLTPRKAKASFITNELGEKIGSEIRVTVKKSRFGTQGRECETKLLWSGENISFQEEEFWLETIKRSPCVQQNGAWTTLTYEDGTEEKFTGNSFVDKLNESEKFKQRVLNLIDQVLLR